MLTAMYRVLVTVLALAGCGRIGFDPPSTGDGGRDARDGPVAPDSTGGSTDASADANLVCPATQPACELCGDLVAECTYGEVCCGCVQGTWNCSQPNPAECPVEPPQLGSACVIQALYCTYCPFQIIACNEGSWVGNAVGC